ncbi:sensor histidine kinase [Actinoplanes sp. CA-015351]|uniref:sensor histidine kinase n=1 Tax=Actinoplanes sp. CA-015351 TaxID=3239897 RepID=UPI003D9889A5
MREVVRSRPLLADVFWAIAVGSMLAVGAFAGLHRRHDVAFGADLAAAAVAAAAFALRRVAVIPVLVCAVAAEVGYLLIGWNTPGLLVAVGAALYQLAVQSNRSAAWGTWLICAVLCWAACSFGTSADWLSSLSLGVFAWLGLPTAFGDSVRNRRAYIAEVEERARRVTQSRDEEVHRRVAEERLRIARELHDVVAHHISVINVQSGAAAYALARRPEAAGPPLAHIRRASGMVLKELASVVGLLRQPSDLEPGNRPHPGLAQVPELIGSFTGAGVHVDVGWAGDPRPVPALTDLAAYRIIQEGLTNASKHGSDGTVSVQLEYTRDQVLVEIVNPVRAKRRATGSGYGLIGMRERAVAAGGTLAVQPGVNMFTTRALLPAPAQYGDQT